MSLYRFADVQKILADLGIHFAPLPVLLHIDEQRAPVLGRDVIDFVNVHGRDQDLLDHRGVSLRQFGFMLIRSFVPRVDETATAWLSVPVWPQFRTYAQERARSYRSEAEADASNDNATPEALTVWRSITGRARLLYLHGLGDEGHRRIFEHMPFDLAAHGPLGRVVAELMDTSALFENLDAMRIRCERRAAAMGRPVEMDGYRFNRLAALDFFALSSYLDVVPFYEAEVLRRSYIDFADWDRSSESSSSSSSPPDLVDVDAAELVDVDHAGLDALVRDLDEEEHAHSVPWHTVQPCDFLMFDEYDGIEIDAAQSCPICMDEDDREGLAIFEGCSVHVVHRACARRMQLHDFSKSEESKCPSCRRSPLMCGPDARMCEICHKGHRDVKMYTLGGGCTCGAVYCWACLPGAGVDCCRRCGADE